MNEREAKREYQRRYRAKYPWANHFNASKWRAKLKGWQHSMSLEDFKDLWDRDKANLLKAPSIDRIDSKKGYHKMNCRFIERSLNSSIGSKEQIRNQNQRESSRRNLKKYWEAGKGPWNKGKKTGLVPWNKGLTYHFSTLKELKEKV